MCSISAQGLGISPACAYEVRGRTSLKIKQFVLRDTSGPKKMLMNKLAETWKSLSAE